MMSTSDAPPECTGGSDRTLQPLDLTGLRRIVLKWQAEQPPIYHKIGVVIGLFRDHTKITLEERPLFISVFSLRTCLQRDPRSRFSWLRVIEMLTRKQVDIATFTAHEFVTMYSREDCSESPEVRPCDIKLLGSILRTAGFDW